MHGGRVLLSVFLFNKMYVYMCTGRVQVLETMQVDPFRNHPNPQCNEQSRRAKNKGTVREEERRQWSKEKFFARSVETHLWRNLRICSIFKRGGWSSDRC